MADPILNNTNVNPTGAPVQPGENVTLENYKNPNPVGVISSEQGANTINQKTSTLNSIIPPPSSNTQSTDPKGMNYVAPPTTEASTPTNNVTLIKADTGQEYTVNNPTADDITKLKGEGWSISSGTGPASTVSTTSDSPEVTAAKQAVTAAQNQVNTLVSGMSKFGISDTALQAQIDSIKQEWQGRIDAMTTQNAGRLTSLNTTGVRLGSQYAGGAGGQFGSILSEEEKQGAQRITDLYSQMNSAIASARIAAQNQNWQVYSKSVDSAQKAQEDAVTALKDLQTATTAQTQAFTTKTNAIANANKIAVDAIASGQGDIAAKIQALNPDSPTFSKDLATLEAGINPVGKYQVSNSTDAFGNTVSRIFDATTGKFVSGGSGGSSVDTTSTNGVPIVGSGNVGTGKNKLSFDQYGLLANTDFNPKDTVDALSQKYLDAYIKNGTVPTASTLGRGIKPEAMAQIDSRARDLYFKATGAALPSPQIIKGYQDIINNNNKLANNLSIQEQTVKANVDMSIANMKANNLNSASFQPLNNFINSVGELFSDPHVGQLIAQNSTIQNELGSLLAVKNASGTTVYDKLTSAGIINKNDPPALVASKVNALLGEAVNFASSLANANASLYKQVDPFLQDPNNPARAAMKVESALNKNGLDYNKIITKTPTGKIPVMQNSDNSIGYITPAEFNSSIYTKI